MDNEVKIIARDGSYYISIDGEEKEIGFAKGKEGKVLRLPKNPSNRKKFSVSKLEGEETVLTYKPQNTERQFNLISKKLLKYATEEELEAYNRICEATKAAWEADRAARSTKAPRQIDQAVAQEMLPKLYKKLEALQARIARYEEVVNG